MEFKIVSPFSPTGDQPEAIAELTHGIKEGLPARRFSVLPDREKRSLWPMS